jgi:uncharacterized iron-regulated protein
MASDLIEKYVVFTHDHARSCQGREYICSCGHDDKITKAADELVNIIQAQDRRIAELEAALGQAKKRMRNCRGAIESNQVVDKDVHGSLTNGMADIDAALRALIPEREER